MTDAERKAIARASSLKRLYGITPEQYQELLDRQDGNCAVCLKHHSEFNQNLAVDHDHVSGEVRGVLCTYCNHRLVGRHRDPDLLRRIADYLERGTGWFVPKKKKRTKRGSTASRVHGKRSPRRKRGESQLQQT